jgi:hypothetical protein
VDAGPGSGCPGGSLGRDLIRWLGAGATLGIDPTRALRADPVELETLVLVAQQAADYQAQRDRALARAIVAEFAASLKRR